MATLKTAYPPQTHFIIPHEQSKRLIFSPLSSSSYSSCCMGNASERSAMEKSLVPAKVGSDRCSVIRLGEGSRVMITSNRNLEH